jgi:hypothetical protein
MGEYKVKYTYNNKKIEKLEGVEKHRILNH